jgi:hypothetical protein
MEVNSQPGALSALPPEKKKPQACTKQEVGWTPELMWMFRKTEK